MPLPTAYSETTLALYMRDGVLKSTGAVLGLTDVAAYDEAVTSTLLAYGAATVAAATDITKLRLLAAVEAWRLACATAAGDYNHTEDDGTTYNREALFKQASQMLASAEAAAASYTNATIDTDTRGRLGTTSIVNKLVW